MTSQVILLVAQQKSGLNLAGSARLGQLQPDQNSETSISISGAAPARAARRWNSVSGSSLA